MPKKTTPKVEVCNNNLSELLLDSIKSSELKKDTAWHVQLMSKYWFRHPQTESVLEDWGQQWWLRHIDVTKIDVRGGLSNQARDESLNRDDVNSYYLSMLEGKKFPACVGVFQGLKILPLGGNHRIEAALMAKLPQVAFYVIETDDDMILSLLPAALNTAEGRRPPYSELVDKAARAVKDYGWKLEDTIRRFPVNIHTVKNRLREWETKGRLAAIGAPVDFSQTVLDQLDGIQDTEVLKRTAELVKSSSMVAPEVRELVRVLKSCGSEKDRLVEIERQKTMMGYDDVASRPGPVKLATRTSLLMALTKLENVLRGNKTLQKLQITTPGDKADVKERFRKLGNTLLSIAGSD